MGSLWAEIADKNQTKLQITFLQSQLEPDGYILDLACGSGRHSIPLTMAGYGMVGLDISRRLLKIAKKLCNPVELVMGDVRFLPFKAEVFAAAINMDTSFGYLRSKKEDMQSLLEVRRALCQNGVFVIDVFNREQLTRKYGQSGFLKGLKWIGLPALLKLRIKRLLFKVFKWREYPSFFLLQKRSISHDGGKLHDLWVISVKYSGGLMIFEHEVRLYGLSQLEGMLAKTGFKVNHVYGGYNGQGFSSDSSQLIISAVAR